MSTNLKNVYNMFWFNILLILLTNFVLTCDKFNRLTFSKKKKSVLNFGILCPFVHMNFTINL